MTILPYQRAFHWVRLAFLDDGQRQLTADSVHGLAGVAPDVMRQVLDDLARAGFLRRREDGCYVRATAAPRTAQTRAS